jgi:hypothetical protein
MRTNPTQHTILANMGNRLSCRIGNTHRPGLTTDDRLLTTAFQRPFPACTLGAAGEDTTTPSRTPEIPRRGARWQASTSQMHVTWAGPTKTPTFLLLGAGFKAGDFKQEFGLGTLNTLNSSGAESSLKGCTTSRIVQVIPCNSMRVL